MAPSQRERGQATTDYVGVLALLCVIVAAALAVATGGAAGIVNAVRGQIASALCTVAGASCPVAPRRPCAVATKRESRRYGLSLSIVRFDKERFVLRERLSDGTIRITSVRRAGAGFEFGIGGKLQIDEDSSSEAGGSREARLGVGAVGGTGDVYYVRSGRDADRVVEALREGRDPHVPVKETILDGGLRGKAVLKAGGPVASLNVDWLSTRVLGRRHYENGDNTISFTLGESGSALASAIVGGPTASLDATTTFAVRLDRHDRPLEMSLLATGAVGAGERLPKPLATYLALSGADAPANVGGRRWELAARVDLHDPQVAAAWRRFTGDPLSSSALGALARTLRERAYLDVRTYRTSTSANRTAIGAGGAVARIGFDSDSVVDRADLVAASSRPPGGLWEQRIDCV